MNNKTRFVIFDFETLTQTGHDLQPIELGAVMLDTNLEQDHSFRFEEFIKPPVGYEFTDYDRFLTGITADHVKDSLDAHQVLQKFDNMVSQYDCIFIAHNAGFDYSIFRKFYKSMPYSMYRPYLDTIKIAKNVLPQIQSYKLDLLAEHLEVKVPPKRHRALIDSQITLEVLTKLLLHSINLQKNSLTDLVSLGRIKTKHDPFQMGMFS